MKVFYYNGKSKCEKAVNNLYHDVAVLLAEESVTQPVTVEITDCTNPNHFLKYRISLRSGTRFIVELDNTMPDCYLSTHIKPVFLTCVKQMCIRDRN